MRRLAVPGALAMLLALAAPTAHAAPRVTAKAAFSPLRSSDWGAVVVTVENDREPRSVELTLARTRTGSRDSGVRTRLPLELGALARREVILPLAPGLGTDCRVDLLAADLVLASAVARVDWAQDDRPLVGCIGEAPASLVAACRRDLDVPLVAIDPASLPGNELGWPRFEVIAWPSPRSTDLDAAQAAALRRHVLAGGRLVLGAIHEDVDALERLGIADIAPAKLSRGDGLEVIAVPSGGATSGYDGAFVRHAALGSVRLVPRDLARGEVAWPGILGIEPPPKEEDASRRGWLHRSAQSSLVRIYPPQDLLDELTPHAPTWLAATLLGACLVAAVPLDAWLTRRTLKRGRRSRFGWLRYPAILLATTVLAYLLADRVGARDLVVSRIDVVDVREPEGAVMGRSLLVFTRGRSGQIDLDADGAQWTGLGRLGGMSEDARIDATWRPPADRDAPLSHASFDLSSWQIVLAEARWIPDASRIPHVQPPTPGSPTHLPPSLAAGIETHADVAQPLDARCLVRDGMPPSPDGLDTGQLLRMSIGEVDVDPPRARILMPGTLGPPLRVAGVEVPSDRSFTLIRYAFTDDAARILGDSCFPPKVSSP